ncbi:hypothetical protein CAEBREN_06290 [Caenorhabditis brenneri]|uniref:Uncharacterized protein n=1 Tax=Caenorhabditis brenneri TaxID=135651 RepID=G0P3T2_CAEBE|nr:hypothetical protein CAEBREN_06290 [Caenorhabditis brenneri]
MNFGELGADVGWMLNRLLPIRTLTMETTLSLLQSTSPDQTRLCKSAAEHLDGRCMVNNEKTVFDVEANKIAAQVLLHFEQSLNPEMQNVVNRLTQEHEQYFKIIM